MTLLVYDEKRDRTMQQQSRSTTTTKLAATAVTGVAAGFPVATTLFYAGLGAALGLLAVLAISAAWHVVGATDTGAALLAQLGITIAREGQVMGLPLVENTKAYWYMARAGGILAYLLLWLGTVLGVLMSGKVTKGLLAYGIHEFLPILAVIFAGLHAAVLLGDQYIGFSLGNLLVPFSAPYRPLWTGLGTLTFYLSAALVASFYVKRWIGRRTWRLFHYTTYLAFTLALVHGMMAGTDSTSPVVRWMYLLTGAALVFATLVRVLTIKRSTPRSAPALRV
jgi:predicted ferric reductase